MWLLSHGVDPELINLAGTTLTQHRTTGGTESGTKPSENLFVEVAQQHTSQKEKHKDRPARVKSWYISVQVHVE